MIYGDNIDQLKLILPEAWEFLTKGPLTDIENGRHELANGHYANVMSYTSGPREAKQYEAHRAYADIQLVIEGEEYMEIDDLDRIQVTQEYEAEGDYLLGVNKDGETGHDVVLKPGCWCLVTPEDAHKPGIAIGEPSDNRKIVVKMAL